MAKTSSLRIALYYVYIDIPASQLREQLQFHRNTCQERDVKGRIRISKEGINGVLSGEIEALHCYEQLATVQLGLKEGCLNVKYCLLREDIPFQSQIFDELIVKETDTVICLFDAEPKKNTKNRRRRKLAIRGRCKNYKAMEGVEECIGVELDARLHLSRLQGEMMENIPAQHLNPDEWHEQLSCATNPLLLDCRNVYESRIGYFASEEAPTLLTNTRKYSDLPKLLVSNPDVREKQEIFMYCTGGVRCERVSMLMQAMYPEKKIFQLRGGIQSYLETQTQKGYDTPGSHVTNLFRGKNFVFDPRRVDPIHGSVPMIGKCIICETPHDDYDNGYAPVEEKEARCHKCRMLVLVCNICRPGYVCWGEDLVQDSPFLFCGVTHCIHEGADPKPQIIRFNTNAHIDD